MSSGTANRAPRSTVSVLMVNYNGGEMLERALGHLSAVADEWDEVVLADNGSSDGSPARVQGAFPDIRLLRLGANLGFGTANNRAAAEAVGDYLLLLNSDAWPRPGTVDILRRHLDENETLGLVAPRLVYPDGSPQFNWAPTTSVIGETIQRVRNLFEPFPWVHRLRPATGGWFTAACALLRREAFEAVGGFDEDFFLYFEDVDLSLRLRRAGWGLTEVDAEAVHVKGGSQVAVSADGRPQAVTVGSQLNYRLGQARYYRKHRPLWEQRLMRLKIRRKLKDPEARILLDREYERTVTEGEGA